MTTESCNQRLPYLSPLSDCCWLMCMIGVISRTKVGVEGPPTWGVFRPDDEPIEPGPQLE